MKQITLKNKDLILVVLDYGAIIQKLLVKNNDGSYTNTVVGYNYPSKYLEDKMLLGACVGRFAGRINSGFEIDRVKYSLYNEKGVHLHGGREGFGKKYWKFEEIKDGDEPFVRLSYLSPHLEEGYPGNLKCTVTYVLKGKNLRVIFEATTDRATVVNLTNHTYFKLDNALNQNAYNLKINSSKYLETDPRLIPTGNAVACKGSPYGFESTRDIGNVRLDTPYVLDPNTKFAAKCSSPLSGLSMEVATNQPGLVVYTPEHFNAICFETQNLPDAPNHQHFPNSILRPGERYRNISEFRFSTN